MARNKLNRSIGNPGIKLNMAMFGFALRHYQDHPAEYVKDFGTHSVVRALSIWKARVKAQREKKDET